MTLRRILCDLATAIADEAETNPRFRANVETALGFGSSVTPSTPHPGKKRGGRRTPAVLDPIEYARQGEATLRARLSGLNIEELRDVVAQYGMDPGKLVMKWKDMDRIRDRIVELSLARATKGAAFREG